MLSTYIVLGDDGRHVSLTRGAMPVAEDVRQIGEVLQRQGKGGWLVRMDGDYWAEVGRLDLTEMALITSTSTTFFAATHVFHAKRRVSLGLPPYEPGRAAA